MLRRLKIALEDAPAIGPLFRAARGWLRRLGFRSSADYWERRYRRGGTSGRGSSGRAAAFKAEVLNAFVREKGILSVVEFGCGDGRQLALADYPRYTGVDVSRTAVERCRRRFAGDPAKAFRHTSEVPEDLSADLTLSLEVIFHLVEDEAFRDHLAQLFGAARRCVVIYSTNRDEPGRHPHVRHRAFTPYVERTFPGWRLVRTVESPRDAAEGAPLSDFYIYEKG